VISHDPTVDRMTGGTGEVAQMSVEELEGLTIPGDDLILSHVGPLEVRYRPALDPPEAQRVLTLDALLETIVGKGILYIDFKAGDLAALAQIVRARGLQDRVYVAARNLDEARILASVPGTAVLATPPTIEELDEFLALGPVLVELTLDQATPEVVERIHGRGVKIMLNALTQIDLPLRFQVLLGLHRLDPAEFLRVFFSEVLSGGILRVQDGVFDPIDPNDLEPVWSAIDRAYGRLVEAGADVIQSDFIDLLVPFARRVNENR
jgi:glycerophosphoryl diester phosphodiesterase